MVNASYPNYEKLKKLHNVTDYRVAKETGIGTATLANWKKNNESSGAEGYIPKAEKIARIAEFFDVPLGYFYE